jgi:dipeptidyl-peptidase-4
MIELNHRSRFLWIPIAGAIALCVVRMAAQDRLKAMPGFDQYTRMQPLIAGAVVSGAAQNIQWAEDGTGVTYAAAGEAYRFDFATMTVTETNQPPRGGGRGGTAPTLRQNSFARGGLEQQQTEMPPAPIQGCPSAGAARGRQAFCLISPDNKLKAFYRARNLWIANFDGSGEKQVTTDGSEKARIKYGTASWVYGEELAQTTAIWWSPDSAQVAFYRFDESQVQDFFVQMNQTSVQDSVDIEAYPKAGAPNPIADVLVYNFARDKTTLIDARDGKPFDDSVVGHYVYGIHWAPDGSGDLLLERANRRQQVVELADCNPSSGKCRTLLREEWTTGWLNTGIDARTSPYLAPRWLKDGKRFIWESERNGWKNYYLYDRSGQLLNPITSNSTFEADSIVKIDEANNVMFYTARDGDNYMKLQLHRVTLDGASDVRLTDPKFNHTVGGAVSSDNKYFVDNYQTHDQPPASQLVDATTGKVLGQMGKSDLTRFQESGFRKAEQYSYLAADGKTKLYGQISFPSNFDPMKKYPTLVSVYGGPDLQSNIPTETFAGPNANTEYGFLVVNVSYRGVPGTGKNAADALYLHLGVAEIDDMAIGIKALWDRPYFDKTRVGIYGTSYGGFTSATMILRYPDVVTVASASSPVTDWRHYDSIYTERYMWLPQENAEGYNAGSDMTYVRNLRGRLLIYYGTADNNVHQNNSMQLIQALQRAGKNFEIQVGPDQPHSGVNPQRMMEFFIENLVMHPERILAP